MQFKERGLVLHHARLVFGGDFMVPLCNGELNVRLFRLHHCPKVPPSIDILTTSVLPLG